MNVRREPWVLAAVGGLLAGLGCSTGTPEASPPPAATADPAAGGSEKNHCSANDADGKHHCAMKDGKHVCGSSHAHDAASAAPSASSAAGPSEDAGAPAPPLSASAAMPDAGKPPTTHVHKDGKPHKH